MAENPLLISLGAYRQQLESHLAKLRERHQELESAWTRLRGVYEGEGAQVFGEAQAARVLREAGQTASDAWRWKGVWEQRRAEAVAELESAKQELAAAQQEVRDAQAQVDRAREQVEIARAQVAEAQAAANLAQADLSNALYALRMAQGRYWTDAEGHTHPVSTASEQSAVNAAQSRYNQASQVLSDAKNRLDLALQQLAKAERRLKDARDWVERARQRVLRAERRLAFCTGRVRELDDLVTRAGYEQTKATAALRLAEQSVAGAHTAADFATTAVNQSARAESHADSAFRFASQTTAAAESLAVKVGEFTSLACQQTETSSRAGFAIGDILEHLRSFDSGADFV